MNSLAAYPAIACPAKFANFTPGTLDLASPAGFYIYDVQTICVQSTRPLRFREQQLFRVGRPLGHMITSRTEITSSQIVRIHQNNTVIANGRDPPPIWRPFTVRYVVFDNLDSARLKIDQAKLLTGVTDHALAIRGYRSEASPAVGINPNPQRPECSGIWIDLESPTLVLLIYALGHPGNEDSVGR